MRAEILTGTWLFLGNILLVLLFLTGCPMIAKEMNHADLNAHFVPLGTSEHQLKIFNEGNALARQVQVEFPDGNDIIPDSEIRDSFPVESMEPGQAVNLIANFTSQTKTKLTVRLKWQDIDGENQEKIVHVTR